MNEVKSNKRGPNKKPGFRQELRVTPLVEKVFNNLRNRYKLRNNSEALHKIAEIYFSNSEVNEENI
jgi:hypothetical protein